MHKERQSQGKVLDRDAAIRSHPRRWAQTPGMNGDRLTGEVFVERAWHWEQGLIERCRDFSGRVHWRVLDRCCVTLGNRKSRGVNVMC